MRSLLEKISFFYIVLCTGLVIIICWYGIFFNQNVLPFWDSWDGYISYVLSFDEMTGIERIYSLFAQHNEHRFLFTRILFVLDFYLFNSSFYLLYAFNAFIPLLPAGVVFAGLKGIDRTARIAITLISASIFYLLVQKENFYWEFQSQFFLAQYVPFLGYYLIVRFWSNRLSMNVVRLSVLTLICAFTMANGILFALPLAILCIPHKNYRFYSLTAAINFIAIYLLYFNILPYHSNPGHGSFRTDVLPDLGRYLDYICSYVGSPFGSVYAGGMGALFIMASAALFWKSLSENAPINQRSFFLLYIMFYGISVAATAMGRVNFGIGQAFAERYQTPTLLAWTCIAILLILQFDLIQKSKIRNLVIAALSSTFLLFIQGKELSVSDHRNASQAQVQLALELGVPDLDAIKRVYPSVERTIDIYKKSNDKKLAFTQIENQWPSIGSQFTSKTESACLGHIDHVVQFGDDFIRLEGWIIDPATEARLNPLIYTENGVIKGLGQRGLNRPDVENVHGAKGKNSGFRLYANISRNSLDTGLIQIAGLNATCSLKRVP